MPNVRPVRRQNRGFAEVTDADNILSGGFNTPTLGGPPGGTPSAGSVTYFTNTGGFLVRTNSAGASVVIGPLYTHVVTTSAELVTALSLPGDIFIVAGAFSIDLASFALDTTPRTIHGAGMDNVTVALTTGGPPVSLDFSAGKSFTGGTVMKDLTLTSAAPGVGPGMVTGLFGAVNVKCVGTPVLSAIGFFVCSNLVNCVATGFEDVPGGVGFSTCEDLVNCRVEGYTATAYFGCVKMANCAATAGAVMLAVPDNAAFSFCFDLVNCLVNYIATAVVIPPHHAFFSCERITNGRGLGPPGGLASLLGYTGCFDVASSSAVEFETSFSASTQLVGCDGLDSLFDNYTGNEQVSGCFARGGTFGFSFSDNHSACQATLATVNGFVSVDQLSDCTALSNTGNGFDSCTNISGSLADSNTGFGYLDCRSITSSEATGNASGPQSGCTRISLNTTTFDDIITPTALAADADDFDLNDAQAARLAVSGGADRTVTGIDASMHPSLRLDIINVDPTFNILLADQDVGSLATNRIITGTSASITIAPDGAARLLRDAVTDRWRVVQS